MVVRDCVLHSKWGGGVGMREQGGGGAPPFFFLVFHPSSRNPTTPTPTPCNPQFGSLIVALGTNYMVNKSTNAAVNAGLWLIAVGFILEAVMTVLATDSPLGAHSWPGRAWRAVAGACTGGRRRTPGLQPLLLVARATDAEAGGPHTVRLLLPKDGAGVEGGGGKGRPAARPAATDVVLQRLIGTGSFSSVFKGTYGATPVAVKVLSAVSPSAQAAARQEARLALSLRHPCVLQTFAVLDVDVPASALADAAAGDSSKSASPGGARLALDAASVALAEFAAVLQAAPGAGGQLLEGAGSSRSRPSGSDATTGSPVPTVPQTWIVQQLADRGTLEHAIRKGVFHRRGRVGVGVGGGSSASPPDAAAAAGGRLGGKGGRTNRLTPVNPTAALLATLHDVASGLAYLHKVGIAHGDLKSANILLTTRSTGSCPSGRQWAAFIADFGLSRALAPAPGVPPAGDDPGPHTHILTHTFGTAAYTAPEIVREGRLSARADCYAFSIVMFEGWAGRQPYAGFPAASIFYRVGVEGRRPSLDGFGDAPPGYVALMTALWADAAYERPTAADAARALGAMLEAEVGAVAASGSAGEPRVEEGRARLAVDGAAPPPSPPPRVVGAEE
jgi:serine/threonine protein kinase